MYLNAKTTFKYIKLFKFSVFMNIDMCHHVLFETPLTHTIHRDKFSQVIKNLINFFDEFLVIGTCGVQFRQLRLDYSKKIRDSLHTS